VTRMYRWALAHERAQNAWMRPRSQRRQAHAIACAEAREVERIARGDPKSRQAWAEIYLDQPVVLSGHWEWTTAGEAARGLSVDAEATYAF